MDTTPIIKITRIADAEPRFGHRSPGGVFPAGPVFRNQTMNLFYPVTSGEWPVARSLPRVAFFLSPVTHRRLFAARRGYLSQSRTCRAEPRRRRIIPNPNMKITKRTQFKMVPRCFQWNELLPGNESRDFLGLAMPISPERWERFSLSPGERAGVRASVKLFKSSAFYIMKDDRQRVRSKPLREVPALNSPSRCQEPFH